MNIDATLQRLGADPFTPVDLAHLNLLLAEEEYPCLDVDAYLRQLDDMADELRPRIACLPDLESQTTELSQYLFHEYGFEGNVRDYYDPRNSFLSDVLDRKLGIPISLSLLAMAVGSRCGMRIVGIGLPGHFLVKAIDCCEEVMFDPFHGGGVISEYRCEELVRSITKQPFVATEDSLAPTPPGIVAMRMMNNLKTIYLQRNDYQRSARIIGHILQLCPDDLTLRRDLGVALFNSDSPGPAINHLEAYLRRVPCADDAVVIHKVLKLARHSIAQWN